MVVTVLLLLFGVPAIVGLTLRAVRRTRAIRARIEEVQEEMARNPQAPYAALAALMQERDGLPQTPRRGKDGRTHG